MRRFQNHQLDNGNIQRGPEPRFIRTSIRHHIQQKWLTTLIGVVGFFCGISLIIWNEARAVKITKLLEESISIVTTIDPEAEVDESNIGKLVYVTGVMTIHEPLTEVEYGISVLAVKLLRQVQMYQWVESESNIYDDEGNIVSVNYNYHTDWESKLIDSNLFSSSVGHWNPKEFPIKRQTQINENVRIGKYYLGSELKKKFTDFIPITSDERPERKDIKLHSGLYYHCQDIFKPEVGDVRIQFYYAGQHNQAVSIVAQLDNTLNLVPYTSKFDINILMLKYGHYSLEQIFALGHLENKFFTWIYRGGGWLLLYISCISLGTILQILITHSPFLQQILPSNHSSLKMMVSMCVSLMATALAWVWYRPILGGSLIVLTIVLLPVTKWFCNNRLGQRQYNRL